MVLVHHLSYKQHFGIKVKWTRQSTEDAMHNVAAIYFS